MRGLAFRKYISRKQTFAGKKKIDDTKKYQISAKKKITVKIPVELGCLNKYSQDHKECRTGAC